jgi:hypothetical protein
MQDNAPFNIKISYMQKLPFLSASVFSVRTSEVGGELKEKNERGIIRRQSRRNIMLNRFCTFEACIMTKG